MSISDAQFAAFLQDDGERKVLLVELDAIYSSGPDSDNRPLTTTIYLADYPYNTKPGELDGHGVSGAVIYRDCIDSTPTFSQSIDPTTLGGKTTYSIGQLVLTNTDGEQDGLLDRIIDGQECRFYLGAKSWPRADFRNVLTAIAQRITVPSQDKISIELRDRGLLLNTDVVGANIGGTGPNAGQPSPIVLGFCNNVELVLEDAATLRYRVADTAADAFEVYDAGFPLVVDLPKLADLGANFAVDTTADTILHPTLVLAIGDILQIYTTASMGITSGQFYYVINVNSDKSFQLGTTFEGSPLPVLDLTAQFNPTEVVTINRYPSVSNLDDPATITLAHAPFGRITCDVDVPIGESGSPPESSRASDLIYELAVTRGGIPSGNFLGPLPSFSEDDDACDFHLGRAIIARENMTDVLDDVLFSVNGFWGFDQFSNLIYGRIRPQDLGSWLGSPPDIFEITSDDIIDIASISLEHLAPTYKDARGYFQKSWATQTDGFAGGVDLDRISYLQNGGLFYQDIETDPFEQGYSVNPSRYHHTMVSSPDYQTLLSQQTCALAFAEFQTWLHDRRLQSQPYLEIFTFKTRLTAIGLRLGDVVEVTLDRFGFSSGVLFQVLSISVDLAAQEIALSLIHRKIPDYTTGFISYP